MKCPKCGRENPEHKFYCGWCTSPLNGAQTSTSPQSKRGEFRRQESNLGFAGGLLIIAGVVALVQAGVFLLSSLSSHSFWFWTEGQLGVCGTLEILLGMIVLYGGIHTIRRTSYPLSVAAAAAAIVSVGFAVSLMLGGIALLMIISSRGEFPLRSTSQEEEPASPDSQARDPTP